MLQILRDIYSDLELSNFLGFKGGTALMFFYNLPRFSVDLDFNLLIADRETAVYQKVRNILLKYETVMLLRFYKEFPIFRNPFQEK
jgi:predicted nucleotidyltransferase component of viral defense system